MSTRPLRPAALFVLLASVTTTARAQEPGVRTVAFEAPSVGRTMKYNVVLPEGYDDASDRYPVLYLLHGMQGSAHSWPSSTSAERYLYESGRNMTVVVPTMKSNFYTDHKIGDAYYTYVAEELPRLVESYLHISPKREKTYVAGLSMGGYGAMKLALSHPEKYSFGASFSGAVDMSPAVARAAEEDPHNLFHFIFGSPEEFAGSVDDTRDLLEQCAKTAEQLPRLYLSCGTADSLFPANKAFAELAKELGYSVKFHIEKEMGHSWRFWDLEVEKLLRTLL